MGHIDAVAPRQVYEIPLVFWLSRQVRERLGGRLPAITSNLDRPFQSDGMIHTLLDLYGVGHRAFQPDRSLFSDGYRPYARFCDTLQPVRAVSR